MVARLLSVNPSVNYPVSHPRPYTLSMGKALEMEFVRAVSKLPSCPPRKITQSELERHGLRDVKLRPYQLDGLSWLAQRHAHGHGCILGDEMGLGKTLQSISLLLHMYCAKNLTGPFLVLAPLSVIKNWESEFERFAPCLKVVTYGAGGKEERERQREEIASHVALQSGGWTNASFPFHVILCHYEIVLKDASFLQKFPWQCLIVDEGHRLKNSNSLLYSQLKQFNVSFSLLLTGTPVQNNLSELYSLLSFVAPSLFPLRKLDRFVETFSNVKDDGITTSLHTVLEPFLLRRVKTEVLLDLPVKSEVILYTGLSAVQKKLYKAILTKDIAAFGEAGSKTRLMNILVQLRKCVNHPYLFDGIEPEPFELGEHLVDASGKLFVIDRLLGYLQPRGHRVLMFSQMTRMLDIVQDYLGYRGYSYERLDGSVRREERFLAVRNFSEDDETFIFLLSTRAGGQGLNLAGADTVIFIDSDFNPQNDLQAAARAHRIGQTRPVKVIRLLGRHSVEEIILKRAHSKLELTNTVIEGGQFSHGTTSSVAGGVADNSTQLADILKFGLDHLLQNEESTIVDEDFESILGGSEGGHWRVEKEASTAQTDLKMEEASEDSKGGPDNMYVYEGEDYSKCSDEDKRGFDQLLAEQLKLSSESEVCERVLRSEHRLPTASLPLMAATRKRKPLTSEELAERRRKREEAKAKRMKLLEEKERRKQEEKMRKRQEYWHRHGYTSLNVALDSSSEEEEEEGEGEEFDLLDRDIHYVMGDVAQPQSTGSEDAIVVHCVDDSGRWGVGGVFSALSTRSAEPQVKYELAGKMMDLSLGDAHILPIDDRMSRQQGNDLLALIVAQTRDSSGRLSAIKLSALSAGLQRVSRAAKLRKASVHLPRIGHSTPNFNWYGTERLIRKHLASKGIPTYIYYFSRKGASYHQQLGQPGPSAQSSQLRPTSKLSSALLSGDSKPLASIFSGMTFCFYNVSSLDTKKQLSRYIVAYDGDVVTTIDENTTHIVCEDEAAEELADDVIPDGCSAAMVSVKWVKECLERGKLLDAHTI